jgi:hypothetical protein
MEILVGLQQWIRSAVADELTAFEAIGVAQLT